MKKRYLIIFLVSFLLISCKEKKVDKYSFITDRIWRTLDYNESQYYFSSSDNSKYIWIPSKREGTKYSLAKGNPKTNPYNPSPEGWLKSATFKIDNDTLFWQSIKDIKGENVQKREIKIGKDTLIGIVNYNTLRAKYYSMWISENKE